MNATNLMILITCLMLVEKADPRQPDNGDSVGPLQLRPIFVKDVNRILDRQGSVMPHFTMADRNDQSKCIRMATIFFMHYMPTCESYQDMALLFHCGKTGMKQDSPEHEHYWQKVRKELVKKGVEVGE